MQNLTQFLTQGLKNTVLFRNNSGTSHRGPWKQIIGTTLLDRWHIGDFSTVEYTISADYDMSNKEIIKALVTATKDRASVVVFSRNSTITDLIDINVTVNDSFVDVNITPIIDGEANNDFTGTKVIFTGQYFHTLNPPVV